MKTRELQIAELNILKSVIFLLDKNNIKYYALGGTLLGAVRHQGFIPWDDDIDIGIPRPDYDRLIDIMKHNDSSLIFQTCETNKNYGYYAGRFVDNSIIVTCRFGNEDIAFPSWIDVFPLDGMPNNYVIRKLHSKYITLCNGLFRLSHFERDVNMDSLKRNIIEKIIIVLARIVHPEQYLNSERCYKRLDKALKKFSYPQSRYLVNAVGAYKFKEMFRKEVYGEGILLPFEDILINCPNNVEFVLRQLYGDYNIIPKESDRHSHNIVDIKKVENEHNS